MYHWRATGEHFTIGYNPGSSRIIIDLTLADLPEFLYQFPPEGTDRAQIIEELRSIAKMTDTRMGVEAAGVIRAMTALVAKRNAAKRTESESEDEGDD